MDATIGSRFKIVPATETMFVVPTAAACAAATAFLARTSGLNATHQTAYTTLICGLVSDGIWPLLDALYIFATADTTTADLNLVSTNYGISVTATCTFSADNGYTGDGSTGFLDTGFNPTSAGGNFTQNSASVGVYDLTPQAGTVGFPSTIGCNDGTNQVNIQVFNGGLSGAKINDNTDMFPAGTSRGMQLLTRTGANARVMYVNKVVDGSDATASAGLINGTIAILAQKAGAGAAAFCAHQAAAAFIGAGLNSTQVGQISDRINAYMTTFGINVY